MKNVYTISDLENRKNLDSDTQKPAKLAVIGSPIAHSKSPQMHQAALDAQDHSIRYIRVQIEKNQVKEALKKMERLGFIGVNVTIPHKEEALEACDYLSKTAQQFGVVNTVHFTKKGWYGDNTDGPGLAKALETELGKTFATSSTLIIGAGGGAGRAIAIQAALDHCPQLTLANRTLSKLDPIAETIQQISPETKLQLINTEPENFNNLETEVIINATSLGMQENDSLPYPAEAIRHGQVFYDAIYTPPETAFLKNARLKNCATANGSSMLVHQGALAYKLWLNQSPNINLMTEQIKN